MVSSREKHLVAARERILLIVKCVPDHLSFALLWSTVMHGLECYPLEARGLGSVPSYWPLLAPAGMSMMDE